MGLRRTESASVTRSSPHQAESLIVNIWSNHELEVKRQKQEEETLARGRYLSSEDHFAARRGGLGGSTVDRTDNEGRRYNVILMAVRQVNPHLSADAVRAEAQRLFKLDNPDQPPPRPPLQEG